MMGAVQWEVGNPRLMSSLTEVQSRASRLGQNPTVAVNAQVWTATTAVVKFGGSTTNVTSTLTWRYDGPMIDAELGWTMAGAANAGDFHVTLPVAAITPTSSSNTWHIIGAGIALDQGAGRYIGHAMIDLDVSTSDMVISTTMSGVTAWGAAVPFTFGNTDCGSAHLRYRWV